MTYRIHPALGSFERQPDGTLLYVKPLRRPVLGAVAASPRYVPSTLPSFADVVEQIKREQDAEQ